MMATNIPPGITGQTPRKQKHYKPHGRIKWLKLLGFKLLYAQ